MKKERRNIFVSFVLATFWLFQFSFHAYHVFTEHTDSKASIFETLPIIKKIDDGSTQCYICAFLNNHYPIYFQAIAVLTLACFIFLLQIQYFESNPLIFSLGKVLLRGPPSFR